MGYAPVTATRAPAGEANPDVLAGLLRVQPVFAQGRLAGYRIFPGGARGTLAFMQLGLKPADLITAVNGSTLDDPGRALEIMQTLSSAGSASVTVMRNGSPLEVNLNLANLDLEGAGAQGAPGAQPPTTGFARRGPFGPRAQ
jgi:type II secretion system protein C